MEWQAPPVILGVDGNLVDYPELTRQVDEWKESGSSVCFMKYHRVAFSGATASKSGLCFLDAVRMALVYLGRPSLVTLEMWDDFEEHHTRSMEYGVRRGDAVAD
ncbi:hypothetical protein ON010_g17572 [Phytophthora cinnamomi]|nr:hypothetical protein ON010_g17572 [Phytophthora cinnamomi]